MTQLVENEVIESAIIEGENAPHNKTTHLKKGKFLINITSNTIAFLLTSLISIWFTPFLISKLGVAAFGLVPLATMATSYLNVLTLIINSAMGRFMTIDLECGNKEKALRMFNTSFFGTTALVLVLSFPAIWLSMHSYRFFNVPSGSGTDLNLLFCFTIATFMITALGSAFQISSFCSNRFELRNLIDLSTLFVKIFVVMFLFKIAKLRIWHVGIGTMVSGVVSFIMATQVCRYLTPYLKIKISKFNLEDLSSLIKTGGWIFISQIGTILILSIDLIVANKILGAEAGGRYASVLQWPAFVRSFAMVMAGVFAPTILYFYAQNNISDLIRYSKKAVKFLGLLMALPIALLCGFSRPLLHLWLGPSFVALAPLMSLMLIHLSVNLGYLPLHNISIATNNVKWPGIVQVIAGVANLVLALFLADPKRMGIYGIALSGGIVLLARNIVFTPFYSAYILKKPYSTFFKELFPISIVTVIMSILCWSLSSHFNFVSWHRLMLIVVIISMLYIPFVFIFLMNNDERKWLLGLLRINPKLLWGKYVY